MPELIKPFVGADVLYWPLGNVPITHRAEDQPLTAKIVRVWSDTLVNIAGFDATGNHFPLLRVALWQGDAPRPSPYEYAIGFCEWPEHFAAWKKAEAERVERERTAAADEKASQAAQATHADKPEVEAAHPNTWVDEEADQDQTAFGFARSGDSDHGFARSGDSDQPVFGAQVASPRAPAPST